jgi:hypothetical protein
MVWVVGVDEAGYGPNLGPLVQAAVAIRLPLADTAGWDTLRPIIRRARDPEDGRWLVDDSKAVHKGANGFAHLERGVWSCFSLREATLGDFIRKTTMPAAHDELAGEDWYDPHFAAPVTVSPEIAWADAISFGERLAGIDARFSLPIASIVCPPRFNNIVDESDSKATVLARGLIELLTLTCSNLPDDGEPLRVICDKQGGRNFYTSLVQSAFPTGWVQVEKEGASESRYRVDGLDREVSLVFRPRADCDSVSVALASMLCKYLREVCMLQFNRFWLSHVPGLAPTAGYPGDARRFHDGIRDAMARLGLTDNQVWRKR